MTAARVAVEPACALPGAPDPFAAAAAATAAAVELDWQLSATSISTLSPSASLPRSGSATARSRAACEDRPRPSLDRPRLSLGGAPPQLWRQSNAVTERAASMGLTRMADLCGDLYIPPWRLRRGRPLGNGAFAVVETATLLPPPSAGSDAPPARTVAVKRLKPEVLESEEDVVSFIQEARLLMALRHPAITECCGLGAADASMAEAQWRTMYLVQEYATDGTLKRLILSQMVQPRRKLYTLRQAVGWALQVAEGLAYLHGRSPMVVHRDLKCENVLLTKGDDGALRAKLADFGLCKLLAQRGAHMWGQQELPSLSAVPEPPTHAPDGSNGGPWAAASQALAKLPSSTSFSAALGPLGKDCEAWAMTGQTGAFVYMAPEVVTGQPHNEKVDVFSFGMVLYELLHRKMVVADLMRLGSAEDAEAFACKVAAGYRLPIGDEVPAPLAKLLSQCLAGRPEDRPSMAEVAARLQDCARSGELEAAEHMHGPRASAAVCCALM